MRQLHNTTRTNTTPTRTSTLRLQMRMRGKEGGTVILLIIHAVAIVTSTTRVTTIRVLVVSLRKRKIQRKQRDSLFGCVKVCFAKFNLFPHKCCDESIINLIRRNFCADKFSRIFTKSEYEKNFLPLLFVCIAIYQVFENSKSEGAQK